MATKKRPAAAVVSIPTGNPNDGIRDALLRYLYEVNKRARSPQSAAEGIRDLTSGMKKSGYSFKQQEIASNLVYLIDKGWVKQIVKERKFTTRSGTTQNSEQHLYRISDTGIDRLESASTFKRTPMASNNINITNIKGVTVVGDGNVVNTTFTEVANVLKQIQETVAAATTINESDKLNVFSDLETIQSQIQKPAPNKSIIQQAWKAVEAVVTAGGFVDLATKAGALLMPLLS